MGAMRQAEGLAVPASMFSIFALVFPLASALGAASCALTLKSASNWSSDIESAERLSLLVQRIQTAAL